MIVFRSVSVTVIETQPSWLDEVAKRYESAVKCFRMGYPGSALTDLETIKAYYASAGFPIMPEPFLTLYNAARASREAQYLAQLAANYVGFDVSQPPLPRALGG